MTARPSLPGNPAGIVFDCDGVLIDSRAGNMLYYNRIRELAGLPPMSREEENFAHMHSARDSLLHILPPALHPRLRELCGRVSYLHEIMPHISPEPGMRDLLDTLDARGLRMAVLTNRSSGMRMVLDTFALHSYFDPVVTAADVRPKPAPDGLTHIAAYWKRSPEDLIFVGDSLLDAQAAEAAGVCFVAYRNPDLAAQAHAASFAELGRIISLET